MLTEAARISKTQPRRRPIPTLARLLPAFLALAAICTPPARAQTATQIAVAASKTCAVMSGERKPDGRSLQLLLLLDEDMGEANPVSMALYHDVIRECPKVYLGYEQRKRAHNPFAPGSLVKQSPTQLTTSGTVLTHPAIADFALRCRGADGVASYDRATVVVRFDPASGPVTAGLVPGRCAWADRGFRPGEPSRLIANLPSAADARKVAAEMNAGKTWTFWVYRSGPQFVTTALGRGAPTRKP